MEVLKGVNHLSMSRPLCWSFSVVQLLDVGFRGVGCQGCIGALAGSVGSQCQKGIGDIRGHVGDVRDVLGSW